MSFICNCLLKGNWVCLIHLCWVTNTIEVQHFSDNEECLCNTLFLSVKFASWTGVSVKRSWLNETLQRLFFVLPFSINVWEADLPSDTGILLKKIKNKKLLGKKGKLNRKCVCLGLLPGLLVPSVSEWPYPKAVPPHRMQAQKEASLEQSCAILTLKDTDGCKHCIRKIVAGHESNRTQPSHAWN